jgi:hypothetical protein
MPFSAKSPFKIAGITAGSTRTPIVTISLRKFRAGAG